MTADTIQQLVIKSNKLGASGMQVVGWVLPKSATDDPNGYLISIPAPQPKSASLPQWFE